MLNGAATIVHLDNGQVVEAMPIGPSIPLNGPPGTLN